MAADRDSSDKLFNPRNQLADFSLFRNRNQFG